MKKFLLVVCLLLLAASPPFFSGCNNDPSITGDTQTYVYICDSKTAYVYHSTENCPGLRHCTHDIIKVTLREAMNKYNRRACKICE